MQWSNSSRQIKTKGYESNDTKLFYGAVDSLTFLFHLFAFK
jgi:hypothetical protein